jgi:hypothetical protein
MGQWKFPGLPTRIPSSNITMQDVPFPVMAYPNIRQPILMQPGGEYNFPNADYVDEYPQMRRGGLKKGKTSRNPFAINKAFAKHQAFRKPRKNVLFDPNSPNFQDGGFIMDLTDDEIKKYVDGGYIVEDISVPELNYQDGGEFYTVKGSNAVYRKNNGKWEIDYNKSGNFQPLSKGDVKQRTAVLDKQAQPYFDRDYSDIVNTKSNKYADTKTTKENKPLTTSQKQAQKNFDKNFKVTKEDRFTEIQNQIEKDKQNYIALAESKGHKATPEELEEIEQRGWNTLGNVGMQKTTPTIGGSNENHISTQFPKNAGIGDYAQRGWEYLTNPFTAFEYAVSGGGAENMPYNINALRVAGIDPGVVEGRNLVGNVLNATTNLFDAGDKVIRNVGEGNYGTAALEATRFLPGARLSTGLGKKASSYFTKTPITSSIDDVGRGVKSNSGTLNAGVSPELIKNAVGPSNKVGANILDQMYIPPFFNKTLNKISPLNYVPGYGKKLEGAVKPLGNVINKNIKNGNLVEQKGIIGQAKDLVGKGVDQPITTKLNRSNADIYSASFNDKAGIYSDITFGDPLKQGVIGRTFNKKNALTPLQSKRTGNALSEIPLTDSGVALNRRLPFSNRYVPIDKQKLLNNEFQWATTGAGLQNVGEKFVKSIPTYGLIGGGLGALTYNPRDYFSEEELERIDNENIDINTIKDVPTRTDVFKEDFQESISSPQEFLSQPDPYGAATIGSLFFDYKKGGIVTELSMKEIKKLIAQGYIVEEISEPKMQQGGTPAEIWKQYTGTPWSEAKAKGLTDGSAEQNLALIKTLSIEKPIDKKNIDLTFAVNETIPTSKKQITTDLTNNIKAANSFNEAFTIARKELGSNQIFEYNGRKYGTNLKGEKFEPTEKTLLNAGLNTSTTKEHLNKENSNLDDPYISKSTVKLEPDRYKNWDEIKEKNVELNMSNNANKIIKYKNITGESKNYIIVDKKKGLMHVYKPGNDKPLFTSAIDLGASIGDAQTVTKIKDKNGDGIIDSKEAQIGAADFDKGNKSTGAGKYYISNIDPKGYGGLPLFNMMNESQYDNFLKTGTIENVATSIHKGFIPDDNSRVSNGCIRCNKTTLDNLTKYLQNSSEVYILPEDVNNEFVFENNQLNFKVKNKSPYFTYKDNGKVYKKENDTWYIAPKIGESFIKINDSNRIKELNKNANNAGYNFYEDSYGKLQKGQGVNLGKTLNYIPIKAKLDKDSFVNDKFTYFDFNDEKELKVVNKFIQSLEKNKQEVMKTAKINGDVYNEIAQIAFGIFGTESNYADTHSAIGNLTRAGQKFISPKSSSSPDYQSKYETYGAKENYRSVGLTQVRWNYLNDDEKKALKSVGITSNSDFLDPSKAALGTTLILGIRYNQQLNNEDKKDIWTNLPKKWNKRDNYAERVLSNSKYLKLEQQVTNKNTENKKDKWGRPSTSKWYGFNPSTKKYEY